MLEVERDDEGRVIRIYQGPEKVDAKYVKKYRKMLLDSSAYGMSGGGYNNFQSPSFMMAEPQYYLDKKLV